jgi:hypothetical protein
MSDDRGYLTAMRLLPFPAAAVKARLAFKSPQHRGPPPLLDLGVVGPSCL